MQMSRFASFFLLLVLSSAVLFSSTARSETLRIGMTQFPANFHPAIESMLAKSFVLGATSRPFVVHDQSWEPVCLLCTQFPTMENGLVKREVLANGGEGLSVEYDIHARATWGDGTPVTSEDVVFSWEMGRHPESGVADQETFRRILSVEVLDEKRFITHLDRVVFD